MRARVLLGATIVGSIMATFLHQPAQAAPATPATVPRALAALAGAPPDDLVAYYPFSRRADEVAANHADGPDAAVQTGASQVDDFDPPELSPGFSLRLDGAAGHLSAPVTLATDKSFTVAAWAKLDKVNRSQVIVSQDGARVSAYALKLEANGAWAFAMPQADADTAAVDVARGPAAAAVAGEWTQLTGVFDAAASELRLFVNGTRVATAKHTVAWAAGGQLQAGRGLRAAAKADFAGGSLDSVRAWSVAVSPETVTDAVVRPERQRADWCTTGNWLHAGGPVIKAAAGAALTGNAYGRDLAVRWKVPGVGGSAMQDARRDDWTAYGQVVTARNTRLNPIFAYLNGLNMKDTADDATFRTQPGYATAIDKFLINNKDDDAAFEAKYVLLPPTKPNQQALDRALAVAADMRAHPDRYHVPVIVGKPLVPSDATIKTWSTNRVAAWLRFGGYPTAAPQPGSAEFRFEVESAKLTWADCDSEDPEGTYTPQSMLSVNGVAELKPGPLALTTAVAHREWIAELAAQAAPRNAIAAAEIQANKDLRTATEAMLVAQYEAWVAGQLLKWQKLWLGRAKTYPGYPAAADFTKVKNAIAAIPAAVQTQLTTAQNATTSANTQVTKVDAAKQQAAGIAEANGTPLYRGLSYAQQSAQVTKASAASAQAASGAIQTTLNAVKATNADAKALQALAATQQAAQQAEFRRIAAQEAAAQAKAAAEAAAKQAKAAAEQAAIAKAKRQVAEQALATAKTTAARAAQHRQVAEQQQQVAAQQRTIAQQRHNEAAAADAEAQRQRDIAQGADADARAQEAVAAGKDQDAQAEARQAAAARAAADRARREKNATASRAAALDAAADAAEGTSDATAARQAANAAQADADRADAAADAAEVAASQATAAAVAAREAATKARAAATKARAAANAAARDAAATRAAAATAHSAAADALTAAHNAAADANAAKASAATARAEAAKAAADSAAAQKAAADARASSAVTAAEAYAAAAWATAARDSAATVIAPANDAIAIGGPFQQTDAAAGLAVLIGQESKTVAEQQAAAATAAADEAAKAAATAAALAAKATADAKLAAQAAADAAAHASAAAKSAAAAQVSAAAAAKDAAAAAAADADAAELARQATRDAAAADGAATAAERDADAADAAADAAERNAASARQAAADARAAANDAQKAADQAKKYAEEAEAAAARARESAQAAEDAADQAEQDANTQADSVVIGPDAPTGMENLVAEPRNLVDDVDQVECLVIDLTHCQATVTHHLTGQIVYFVRTCPEEGVTHCPGEYVNDYLTTVTLSNKTFTETRIFNPMQITLDFWKAIGKAFISDFVDCFHGKLTKCGILAAEFLAPAALGLLVKAIVKLRYALRAGRGIDEAVAGVQAAGLDSAALSNIERAAATSLAEAQGATPAIANVRARLVELLRRRSLGLDSAVGAFRRAEMETALRIEAARGVRLTRSTGTSEDWIDGAGRTYDAVGSGLPAAQFEAQWPNLQRKIVDHLVKAQYVPVDVATLSPAQVAKVRTFVAELNNSNVFIVGG